MTTHKGGKGDRTRGNRTRRSILIDVAGGAAAMASGVASAQAQSARGDQARIKEVDNKVRKILAVAVGKEGTQLKITNATTSAELDKVRPYIAGLIVWLKDNNQNPDLDGALKSFVLGNGTNPGYTIDYREASIKELDVAKPAVFSDLTGVDCIVCMSTYVGEKAADATTAVPIVVITSDPSNKKFGNNVCGVCAIRPHLTGLGLRKFRKRFSLKKVYGLNREGYAPSAHAKKDIGKAVKDWVDIKDSQSDADSGDGGQSFHLKADSESGRTRTAIR